MTDQERIARLRKQHSAGRASHLSKADRLNIADRIEELVKERDHAWKMVAEADARLGQSLGDTLEDKRKLAKAVEALQAAKVYIDDLQSHEGVEGFSASTNQAADTYYAALAEVTPEGNPE